MTIVDRGEFLQRQRVVQRTVYPGQRGRSVPRSAPVSGRKKECGSRDSLFSFSLSLTNLVTDRALFAHGR